MIGVFTAELEDAYQAAVWRGIEERAQERKVGVVSFLGSRLESPVPAETAANFAYRVASPASLDGVIVITSAITTFLDSDGVGAIFERFGNLPSVSVGVKVPGISSVTVDGSGGVTAVVRHLIETHGRRRFAVIGGPPGHAEAEDRERAFRRALAEAGVEFDERLFLPGIFVQESGTEAVRQLATLEVGFDALVCMNDRMAIGALDALREAGLRVPEDVAVVGFDGIEESTCVTPPLTTVIQPLQALGANAVDALCDLIHGGASTERVLSCVPAIRESCGCLPSLTVGARLRTGTRPERGAGTRPGAADPSPDDRAAIGALRQAARRGDVGGFVARLNAALGADAVAGRNIGRWHDYLLQISRDVGADRPVSQERTVVSLLEFSQALVGRTESRRQAARRVRSKNQFAALRTLSASLAGSFEIPVMLERLSAGLRDLGIGGAYLAVLDRPDTMLVRLLLSPDGVVGRELLRDERDRRHPEDERLSFSASELVPADTDPAYRNGLWVFEPLVFQEEVLGYMLLPGGFHDPSVYGALRDQVASALKGALLLEQVRTHERRLEEEVARRTAALTSANEELTVEIERRTRLEQEVIEISNRTMERIGQDLHDDLSQHLAGIAMLASVVKGDLEANGNGAASALGQICTLLEESIARAKQIARGLVPAALQEHGLSAAVEELAASARKSYPVHIDFRASPHFHIEDTERALQVYRIIQEALSNALKHAHTDRVEIRLRCRETDRGKPDGTMVAEVSDYGFGFVPEAESGGMGLRIMRYRAEKANAELRIEQLHPGTRVVCRLNQSKGAHR